MKVLMSQQAKKLLRDPVARKKLVDFLQDQGAADPEKAPVIQFSADGRSLKVRPQIVGRAATPTS